MNTVSPVTKTARHAQIAAILAHADPPVRSQEELAERLGQHGVRVTQATLSRDLEELGAVRLRAADGGLVYALPGEAGGPGSPPGGLAEADAPWAAPAVEAAAARAGFLVNAVQPDAIRLAPPLILSAEQADSFTAELPAILSSANL